MSQGKDVNIRKAKGRPMLTWVGKKPLTRVRAYPAQHVERFEAQGTPNSDTDWSDWPDDYERGGLLFHGDNKDVLAHLLANGFRGKIKLIYIDPPFDSGADYVRKVQLRGVSGSQKIDGEEYTLGEQIQYTDIWANDNYLQFMYERLLMLRELLAQDGLFWLHCDSSRGHLLRCIADEIFGADNLINQIVWKRSDAHSDVGQGAKHLGSVHDMLFLYSKSNEFSLNTIYTPLPDKTIEKWYRNIEEKTGRRFNKADVTGPGGSIKGNPVYEWNGITRAWRYSKERMQELHDAGRLVYSSSGMPYQKRYLDESKGVPLQDWWDDISMVRGFQQSGTSLYPTEKPEKLLKRILRVSSDPGDIILDCFIGSGTTAAVAQKLGHRWIGCDINKGAIQTTAKRLQAVINEQAEPKQKKLVEDDSDTPLPCQLSFSTWRVNDYDLQTQHNEAVRLACDYIGVTRNRADSFFDGTHGKRLVKIVPFNHPLTPLDVEDVKGELAQRPEEERDIEMVCLGIELEAQAAIEAHNRNRTQGPNRFHVIELRTDPKYGGFIQHEPMTANVHVERTDDKLRVEVTDVLSPTIVKRLNMEEGLFKAQIDDWRAVVDAIMIDTDHDGEVFNIAFSDVPERKSDLVEGRYELPAPRKGATVAVKIIDMLGEETIFTETV